MGLIKPDQVLTSCEISNGKRTWGWDERRERTPDYRKVLNRPEWIELEDQGTFCVQEYRSPSLGRICRVVVRLLARYLWSWVDVTAKQTFLLGHDIYSSL